MIDRDDIRGALLGTAVGDALGMPIEGLSHQNVRTYYLGIKEYRDDLERKDLDAGQWTDDTQFTFALARVLAEGDGLPETGRRLAEAYVSMRPEARRWGPTTSAAVDRLAEGTSWREAGSAERATNGAPMRAAPLGAWWALREPDWETAADRISALLGITHAHPASLAAGIGHARAVALLLRADPDRLDGPAFFEKVLETVRRAEAFLDRRREGREEKTAERGDEPGEAETSGNEPAREERAFGAAARTAVGDRLTRLRDHLTDTPLDLQDLCDGTGAEADTSWPYALAMMARNPGLIEATLLSGINVGGDADTIGAFLGGMLGSLHGWSAFPDEWRKGLEEADRLLKEADRFYDRMYEGTGPSNSPTNEISGSSS